MGLRGMRLQGSGDNDIMRSFMTCTHHQILMDLQVEWAGMNWIDLAQDMESWWALVNAIINFLVA